MKRKLVTWIAMIALLATTAAGSTFALNQSIASAQEAEDATVVTAPAILQAEEVDEDSVLGEGEEADTAPTIEDDAFVTDSVFDEDSDYEWADVTEEDFAQPSDVAPSAEPTSEIDLTDAEEAILTVSYLKESDQVPADKDLKLEDAAYRVDAAAKNYLGAPIDNVSIEMQFSNIGSSLDLADRPMWYGTFYSPKSKTQFWCEIDSVTGQVYAVYRFEEDGSPDEMTNPPDGDDLKPFVQQKVYETAAIDFVAAKFPDKEITYSKNLIFGDANTIPKGGSTADANYVNGNTHYVEVAVDFADGSGYLVSVGANTKSIRGFRYFPNGAKNYLS
jgi:hypothetical protein